MNRMELTVPHKCLLLGMAFVAALVLAGCAGKATPVPRQPQSSHGTGTVKTFRPIATSPMAGGGG